MSKKRSMKRDFFVYNIKMNPSAFFLGLIDLIFFVISLVLCGKDILSLERNFLNILLLAVSLVNLVYTIYCQITTAKVQKEKLINSQLVHEKHAVNVVPGAVASQKSNYIWGTCPKGSFTFSEAVNQHLFCNQLQAVIADTGKKKMNCLIQENYDNLYLFLRKNVMTAYCNGSMFVNEKKLCINKDLHAKDTAVYCHQGSYYDTYLTNITCNSQLISTRNKSIVANNSAFFCCDKGQLRNISSSYLNNEIGISTIGIADDCTMVFWTQNPRSQSSQNLLVPTGSGSCDWDDLQGDDFTATICYAMEREMREESHLPMTEKPMDTKIIGYYRWLEKGGKPEFVGISRVHLPVCEFDYDSEEVYEKMEVHFYSAEQLPKVIQGLLDEHSNNMSVPLYVNLITLQKLCETNMPFIEKFIQ